jgi:hypothetical protein
LEGLQQIHCVLAQRTKIFVELLLPEAGWAFKEQESSAMATPIIETDGVHAKTLLQ